MDPVIESTPTFSKELIEKATVEYQTAQEPPVELPAHSGAKLVVQPPEPTFSGPMQAGNTTKSLAPKSVEGEAARKTEMLATPKEKVVRADGRKVATGGGSAKRAPGGLTLQSGNCAPQKYAADTLTQDWWDTHPKPVEPEIQGD